MNCGVRKPSTRKPPEGGTLHVTYRVYAFLTLLLLGASAAGAQTYASWAHHRSIFFNTTGSGANVSGNVANFPVRIHLDAGNFDFSQALANGEDIRFEDPNGTVLPYQIEVWNAGMQAADLWVRVPQVDGNSGQDFIRMHWGKPGAASESNGPNVFQTANDFAGVWHLNEDGNNSAGGYPDATGNGYHGTGIALNTSSDVPGLSGNAQNFNSASNQGINFGAGTMLHPSTPALTVEAWFNANTLAANRTIIGKPYTTGASPYDEYRLSLDGTGTKVAFTVTTGGLQSSVSTTTTLSTNTWYHVAGVFDGSTIKIFLNGLVETSTGKSGSINNYNQPLTLGKYFHDNTMNFDGRIEEPRVMGAIRNADWIKLTYAAMRPSPNLVVMGPRVWDGGGADDLWSNPANWNGDILPTPDEDVLFDGFSSDNVTLNQNVLVRSLVMNPGYTGNFSFATYSLTILEGVADFRSGGTLSPGSGQLIFAGPTPQNFHPLPGATFPAMVRNGGGTTTVATHHLTANGLSIMGGTFDLNSNARTLTCQGNIQINGGTLLAAAGSLDVSGDVTLSAGNLSGPNAGAAFNVEGSFTQTGGTFNSNGGTVVFDGPASGKTVSLIGAFENITFNGSGSWTAGSNLMANTVTLISGGFDLATRTATLNGNLNINGGALTAVDGVLSVAGNFSLSGGSISMPSGDMTVSGNVTRTGGTATHNNGWLRLTGAAGGKSFNFSPTLNNLDVNGSGGSWTVSGNAITAIGTFQVQAGTFNLGSSLSHSISTLNSLGGNLDFNSSTLSVSGSSANLAGLASVVAGSGTLAFTTSGATAFTPKSGATHPNITVGGTGTVALSSYGLTAGSVTVNSGGLDLSSLPVTVNGSLTIAGGALTATNASPLMVNGNLTLSGGAFDMPSGALYVSGNLSRTGGTAANHYGTLRLNGAAAGKTIDFSPTLFSLVVAGSGGEWTVINNGLTAENAIDVQAGTLNFGSGLTHSTYSINSSGGALDFGSSTVRVTGNTAFLDGLASLVAGTGILEYPEAWLQTLTARAGTTNPTVVHSGSGTLRLLGNALQCNGFTQSNGILDLNGFNITTAGSSNFQVTNGNSSSLANLAGRVITVGGNAILNGASSADRLNLNPGAVWYLNAAGTANVQQASVMNGDASGGSTVSCFNCANQSVNSNWTFAVTWDGGGGNANWTTGANWGSDVVPSASDNVTFNSGTLGVILDANATVNNFTMTSGYSGSVDFGNSTLTIAGDADFRSSGGIIANTGAIAFTGTGNHAFIPKSGATLPNIIQNGSAATTTVTLNALTAGDLSLGLGTFHLGASMAHSVRAVSGFGSLDFGTSNLNATGDVNLSSATVTAAASNTLAFTGTGAQTFTPKASLVTLNLTQNGSGGTTVSGYDFTTPLLTLLSGTLHLGASRFHSVTDLSISGGGLDFQSSSLQVGGSAVNLAALGFLDPGTGTLRLAGAAAQTFTPKSGSTHPNIVQYGAGGTTLAGNLTALSLNLNQGTFHLGSGFTHTFNSVSDGGGGPYGSLNFGSSQLQVSGTVSFYNTPTLTAGTGSLHFIGTTGTQNFTPKSGGAVHPPIHHTGASTLRLYGALTCQGFNNSAGTLDFNINNITTVSSGDFIVSNGNSSTFTGLGGRNLTVDGNATFSGASSASPINLNPGTAWTLAVNGTLTASLAALDYSNASLSTGVCANCADGGSNNNWTTAITWDGGGADDNWSTTANWGLDAVPTGADNVVFDGTSSKNAILNSSGSVKTIRFTSGYTGTFSFGSGTLDINGASADMRTGGSFSAGSGGMRFLGSSPKTLIPPASGSLPNLEQVFTGTLTITTNPYVGNDILISDGTLHLGTGLTHTVHSIDGTNTATLDFGGSNLNISAGGTADFLDLYVMAGGANTLAFTGNTSMAYIAGPTVTGLRLAQTGTGATTVQGNSINLPSLTLSAGTFNLGSGFSHTFAGITATGGTLDFGSSTLNYSGSTLDLSGLAGVTAGTGILSFNISSAQTFIPMNGAVFPSITKVGTGTVTLAVNPLVAGNLTIDDGVFNLGSGLTHTVGSVSGSGSLDFGTSDLHATGSVDLSGLNLTAPSNTLAFTGSSPQTFIPKASVTGLHLAQNGSGGTTISTYGFTAPSLTLSTGAWNLGSGLTHSVTSTLNVSGGTLNFGSSTLRVAAPSVNLDALSTLTAGTGALEFTGTSAQTFTPKSGAIHPALIQNGSAGTTVATQDLTTGSMTIASGTWNLGAGLNHTYSAITSTGGGLSFGTSTLGTAGNADFSGLATLTAGSGILWFNLASGTQVFTPKNGAVHPLISHTGGGTLQLSGSDLTALEYIQSGGVLDFNGFDLTISSSGSLEVSGNTSPFIGLAGRTLTVGGLARFTGFVNLILDLNPASAWTLAVTGNLTAVNARIRNCQATVAGGTADSSVNEGGNANWTFLDNIIPDNVTDLEAAAIDGHSMGIAWTASVSPDADSVMLRYRTDGSFPSGIADGVLWRKVAASKTSDTVTSLADGTVYHFAAFVEDSSGNYSPSAAGAQTSASTPDVTPPDNVTAFAATAISAGSTALSWTPSAAPDADSVMVRYVAGLVPPADETAGSLWAMLPASADKDTVTGLSNNTIYAFSLFVRDPSGNYSPGTANARDTSLIQVPVAGSLAISDASGFTRDADPSLAFSWSGSDSLRFSLVGDTATATWRTVAGLDSLNLGADGRKILAAQFKNVFGNRSAWVLDTTVLDRQAPAVTLDLKPAYGRWSWPAAVSGKSKDSQSGNDLIQVTRRRVSDGYYFNGSAWTATPDTAEVLLTGADSLFSVSMPVASMTTGDYVFSAHGRDRLGNAGSPVTQAVHFEGNRIPALAFGNLPDTVLQNQAGAWKLDFGDLDTADSLAEVSVDVPAWLAAVPGPDTSSSPWAVHRTYALAGKPLQANAGVHSIQVRVQDRGGLTFTYSKSVFVADVNDAPVFEENQAAWSAKEDTVSTWKPKFKDEDVQDTHAMTLLAAPTFARLDGMELTFKPGSRDVGTHPLRLVVSDGSLADTLETAVNVTNVNDPPYAFPSAGWKNPAFFREDQADTFSVVVVDLDRNEPVTLATLMPSYVKVSSSLDSTGFNRTFRFVVKPAQNDTGLVGATLTFKDAGNATSQLAWSARVLPSNDTPSAAIEETRTHAGAARVLLSVSDEDGSLEKARFYYRLVGPSGDTVRRGITSSSHLALHPLADGAYRLAVMAEDQDGLRQAGFTVAEFAITGATALALDTARWHMVGVPHASLPASVFGAGATLAAWDEVGDDGQPMARYASGKTVEALKRGKGYWVRLAQPAILKAEQKDLHQGPWTMKLTHAKQGWNQVANPYPYWVDISASRLTFWEWDADRRDLVNARGLLKPWAAYWVLAPRDTVLKLADAPYFPAPQAALAKASSGGMMGGSAGGSMSGFSNRGEWSVQLALRAGAYHDRANVMGVMGAGSADAGMPGGSGLALADAPKFGDYVALHFEKGGSGNAAQGFAADYRSAMDPDEEWWDFSVENSGTGESRALLTPAGLEPLAAAGLRVFLVRQGEARPVEPGETVSLAMEEAKTHYSLVVTPHADFASRLKGNFSVSQNFPNPVTTFTAFRFVLPQSWDKEGRRLTKDFNLRINLYDYSGRQVARVASGKYRPGSHTLLWRPASASGGTLAKGSYIYRLETPGFVKSMKMVLE